MEQISGIYCITNQINGKVYIGLSKDCYRRWNDHKDGARNHRRKEDEDKPLYKAMRKYGIENFTFEIIEQCDESLLKEREIYWIEQYDSYRTGYNATRGGDMAGPNSIHIGEEHPRAILTEEEVIFCREKYREGAVSSEIYNQYFKDKMNYKGFQSMWHGKTWKHIMPEVFENNPRPRQKITPEDILEIRTKYYQGVTEKALKEEYKDKYSPATVHRVLSKKDFCPELCPDIPDNHVNLRQKVTPEMVRLVRQLKSEGKLHKEIRAALNNEISMTTISDIVTGKRYSDII